MTDYDRVHDDLREHIQSRVPKGLSDDKIQEIFDAVGQAGDEGAGPNTIDEIIDNHVTPRRAACPQCGHNGRLVIRHGDDNGPSGEGTYSCDKEDYKEGPDGEPVLDPGCGAMFFRDIDGNTKPIPSRKSSVNAGEGNNMNDKNELNEDELEVLNKTAQVTDNPLSGFGRPFSNDNPMMSEQYFQDNPAAATSPYSGPSSYSINTVAPYNPPNSGLENPSQNVGPYGAPGHLPVTTDADYDEDDLPINVGQGDTDPQIDARTVQSAYKDWNDSKEWYDGTPEAIYNHISTGDTIRKAAAYVGDANIEFDITEQLEVLRKVANEISDANLEEYLEEVPGGTVALEYDDLSGGGLVDTESFLHHAAALLIKDVNETDWDSFASDGARRWIADKVDDNPGLLRHEAMVRKAAVDYAKDKTMVLMDPIHRADLIDTFVTNAERFRREAADILHKALEEETAVETHKEAIRQAEAKRIVEAEFNDDFFPGAYVTEAPDFVGGQLAIGEDDGSVMYEAARQSLASFDKDWPEFTTEGAREWFVERVEKNSGILRSPDLTYRASSEYAREATKFVKDASLKNEIVRAFTESTEFLRDQWENARTASGPERSEFDDIYENEDEILW